MSRYKTISNRCLFIPDQRVDNQEHGGVKYLDSDLMTCRKITLNHGYYTITFMSHSFSLHRIIGFLINGSRPTKQHTIDHIDRNKTNNSRSNIRWALPSEQMRNRDAYKMRKRIKTEFQDENKYVEVHNVAHNGEIHPFAPTKTVHSIHLCKDGSHFFLNKKHRIDTPKDARMRHWYTCSVLIRGSSKRVPIHKLLFLNMFDNITETTFLDNNPRNWAASNLVVANRSERAIIARHTKRLYVGKSNSHKKVRLLCEKTKRDYTFSCLREAADFLKSLPTNAGKDLNNVRMFISKCARKYKTHRTVYGFTATYVD